jgi:hypothetical protein
MWRAAISLGRSLVSKLALCPVAPFGYALPCWRKAKEWRRQLKRCERMTSLEHHGLNRCLEFADRLSPSSSRAAFENRSFR